MSRFSSNPDMRDVLRDMHHAVSSIEPEPRRMPRTGGRAETELLGFWF